MTIIGDRSAPAPVDPRIRARRIEVRRQQGRRRLRVLTAVLIVASLVGLAVAASASGLLDVERVVVVGAERADPRQLVAVTGITPGDALVTLDTDGAASRVRQVPWVAEASIGRSIDGTVTVTVRERRPAAAVPVAGGSFVLVDGDGRQLEQVGEPEPGIVVVSGVQASGVPGEPVSAEVQGVLRLLHALTPPVLQATSGIGLDGGDLVLELAQGGRVLLGDASGLDVKLVALETMLARVDLRCLHELDLGVPSAPALTRTPATSGNADDPLSDLSECP